MATNSLHIVNHARAEFHVLLKHGKGQKMFILHFFNSHLIHDLNKKQIWYLSLIPIIFIFVECLTEYK